jgi:hypothetical protein
MELIVSSVTLRLERVLVFFAVKTPYPSEIFVYEEIISDPVSPEFAETVCKYW